MNKVEIKEWLKSLKDVIGEPQYHGLWNYEEVIDTAIKALSDMEEREWIPCSERLPVEHEWIGTKEFGTTISDMVLITFDVHGTRFVKPMSLQNGELSRADKKTMDVFYKDWKMLAWMPLAEPYKGGDTE